MYVSCAAAGETGSVNVAVPAFPNTNTTLVMGVDERADSE